MVYKPSNKSLPTMAMHESVYHIYNTLSLHLQYIYRPPANLYLWLVRISSTFSTVAISLSWPKRLYLSSIKGFASSYAWSSSLAISMQPN